MADWITTDQYLDLVIRACDHDQKHQYQVAGVTRAITSTSVYVYLIRDHHEITRLRFSSHGTHFHQVKYTINVPEVSATLKSLSALQRSATKRLKNAKNTKYAQYNDQLKQLLALSYVITARHGTIEVNPFQSQIIIKCQKRVWIITSEHLIAIAKRLVELNLLRISSFYDQHQLVPQKSIAKQVIWMFQNPDVLVGIEPDQLINQLSQTAGTSIETMNMRAYQYDRSDLHVEYLLAADSLAQSTLHDWRQLVINTAKQMTFDDQFHLFAYDSLPRATSVILYFCNANYIYRVRVGQKPTDYQYTGLNSHDIVNNYLQLDARSPVEQIVDTLRRIDFSNKQVMMPITYQLMVSLQLLRRVYHHRHYYIHARVDTSYLTVLPKHYGYDAAGGMTDIYLRQCLPCTPYIYLPNLAVTRWLTILRRCNFANVEGNQVRYRLPGMLLLEQYDQIRYFHRGNVWDTDLQSLKKVRALITQLCVYSGRGIRY